MLPFILENIITPIISSFFVVIGGAAPVAILIYFFSKKEKERLLAHADEIEKTLPLQEQLLEKYAEVIEKSITPSNVSKSLDSFKEYIEAHNMVEENKRFIKYARNYNAISAVGHFLRMSNYMPKSIKEHRELSKDLPSSQSSDT